MQLLAQSASWSVSQLDTLPIAQSFMRKSVLIGKEMALKSGWNFLIQPFLAQFTFNFLLIHSNIKYKSLSLTGVKFCILCNLEINKNSIPSAGAVDMFASQVANNPAVPQLAQMSQGVSRSDLLPGNNPQRNQSFNDIRKCHLLLNS